MSGGRVSNEVILAKTETTYNTDSTPSAGSNAVLVRNVKLAPEGLRMNDRAAIRASLGQLQEVYGGQLKRLTFEVEVKGSGTAGTAPEIGPLIEACGFNETIVASTSVTYLPESSAHESITLYWYEFGRKLHKLTGARGNFTIKLEAGGICLIEFDFVGHYTEPTDQTQPTPTYNSQVPKAGLGMTVAINGVSAIVAKRWQWSPNNTIVTPASLSSSDGYGEILISKRKITGQMEIESELDSVLDLDLLFAAGTRFAFASGQLGSTAGNRLNVTTPASSTYVTNTEPTESDGLRQRQIDLAVDDSTADTELSLAFT